MSHFPASVHILPLASAVGLEHPESAQWGVITQTAPRPQRASEKLVDHLVYAISTTVSSAACSFTSSPIEDPQASPATSISSSIADFPSPRLKSSPPVSPTDSICSSNAPQSPEQPAVQSLTERKALPPSPPSLRIPKSFSSSRQERILSSGLAVDHVPRQTLIKALASIRPALSPKMPPSLRQTAMTAPMQKPLASPAIVEVHNTLVDKPNETITSPPATAKIATAMAPLQSPCFYHQRFDPAVNVERVLEEIAGDEYRSHSRLVQTALGVREVARQLQRRKCKTAIRNIMIVTKARDNQLVTLTRELAVWLMMAPRYGSKHGVNVYVDKKLKYSKRFNPEGLFEEEPELRNKLKYWTPDLCWAAPETFDLVLTLGGDGTVLFTSWLFQRIVPPILSFSLGSLGFLTNFKYDLYHEILDNIMEEGMRVNMRMRFTCTVYRQQNGESVETDQFEVLNELVIDRGPSPYVSNLELYGDDDLLTVVQADGCIFSTPTGSTAYSLSAGGSLVHPDIPAILLTPICPHTLSFRPMLLNDSMLLRIAVPKDSRATAWCAFDGKGRIELRQGDFVTIAASQYPFPTVLSNSTEWIDSISRTLRWNTRGAQQKAWDSSKASGVTDDDNTFDIDTDSGVYNSDSEEDNSDSPVSRKMALLGMM